MQFTSLLSYLLPSCPPAPAPFPFPLPSPVPYPSHSVCNAAIEYPATRCVCNKLSSPKRRMRMQGLSVSHSLLCLCSVCCVSSRHARRGAYPIPPPVLNSNTLPSPTLPYTIYDIQYPIDHVLSTICYILLYMLYTTVFALYYCICYILYTMQIAKSYTPHAYPRTLS